MTNELRPGAIYKHYKSDSMQYEIICRAVHSESDVQLVVYKALYGEGIIYARPLDMFQESVLFGGKSISRFTLIDSRLVI